MDHLMVDVGDHPVAVGDVVQLFGDAPGADELAAYATRSRTRSSAVWAPCPRIYVR